MKYFHDVVDRPFIELSGRFKEEAGDPGRRLTAVEIEAIRNKLAPPPVEQKRETMSSLPYQPWK